MDEKKLYPLRFCRIEDSYSWGSESFMIADLGYRDSLVAKGWLAANSLSEVMDTYMDRVVGDDVFASYGRQFPVQVRYIKCSGRMPLRVCPDDTVAEQRYDALGKDKLWYVARCGKDAALLLGFREEMDAASVLEGAEDGSLLGRMNVVRPKAGENYRISPGTVHGAIGDVEIIEISESSALDFCVSSWGEGVGAEEFDESLTIIDALDFIDYAPYKVSDAPLPFTVRKIELRDALRISSEKSDSFAIYLCLYGKAAVEDEVLSRGDLILVPSEVDEFILSPREQNSCVLEVMVEPQAAPDPYINPNAEPNIEEDE